MRAQSGALGNRRAPRKTSEARRVVAAPGSVDRPRLLVVASVLLDDDDLVVVVVAMPIVRMMMSAFRDDDPLAFGLGRRQGHHESNGGKCRQRHSDLAHSSSSPVFSPRENSSR